MQYYQFSTLFLVEAKQEDSLSACRLLVRQCFYKAQLLKVSSLKTK